MKRDSTYCGSEYSSVIGGACSYCTANYIYDDSSPWINGCSRTIKCCINNNYVDFGEKCNYAGGCVCLFVSAEV